MAIGFAKRWAAGRWYLLILAVLLVGLFTRFHFYSQSVDADNIRFPFSITADNITGFPRPIVPNIVHLVHFGNHELTFGELLVIKTAFQNHKPEKVIIHCDCHEFTGKYWDLVKDLGVVEVTFKEKPSRALNGKKFSYVQHASDVARIEVLMEHGGIYLDSDVYVVSSLNEYLKYEMTLDWDEGEYLGTQILIAHKNARFLKLWHESYREYDPNKWYYNAGELPTKKYLYPHPELIHRVKYLFGVHMSLPKMLFEQKTDEWKKFKTIHLLLRFRRDNLYPKHPIRDFDLDNIKTYNYTFGDMARLVLYGSTDLIK